MHRALIPLLLLLSNPTLGAEERPDCGEGPVPFGGCQVVQGPAYLYESEFGGRGTLIEDPVTADASVTHSLAEGYYLNQLLTWSAPTFAASNIKDGVAVFGLNGSANASLPADCALDGSLGVSARCTIQAPPNAYVYAAAFGGRSTECSITANTSPTPPSIPGACWMASPNTTIRSDATTPMCTVSGPVSKSCIVSAGYWYTTAFNGRSATCINGTNSSSCWLNAESAYAGVSTACNENATNSGYNTAACKTAGANRYVYSSSMGGRGTTCSDTDQGYCWIGTAQKSGTASNLIASNIRSGKVIFGVTGNYQGTPFSWGSGAHRAKSGTASPNRITYTYETNSDGTGLATTANLPSAYAPVPKISVSTDAYKGSVVGPTQVTAVTRTGWSTTTCGTSGTLATRIANCASVFSGRGTGASWNGAVYGNAGQAEWKLVTRTYTSGVNYEVWQDQATGLLWSSQVTNSSGLGWCIASGNSNSTRVDASLAEADPAGICTNSTFQNSGNNNAWSACYEGTGFSAAGVPAGKAGLTSSLATTNGRVRWRLPTMYDYIMANHHGLRFVLPDIGDAGEEWTATVNANDRQQAWTFDGRTGSRQTRSRMYSFAVRCVGR